MGTVVPQISLLSPRLILLQGAHPALTRFPSAMAPAEFSLHVPVQHWPESPAPSSSVTEKLLRWAGYHNLIRELIVQGGKIIDEVPKQGQRRLGPGPALSQPLQSCTAAKAAPPTAWSPSAAVGRAGPEQQWHGMGDIGWERQICTQNSGVSNTHLHQAVRQWVTPQQPPWERSSFFLQALLWHPGDQLCHGTQGTPALQRHPANTRFPASRAEAGLSHSSAGILPPRFKHWLSSAHRVQPVGVQSDPKKGQSHSWHPCFLKEKQHSLNAVSYELC